ncbi:MAG: DUF1634 domain-containing protein [Chloroflexota bacterium]|jgi:uncharacterized membrane protein|nr:DUF1634 domain-containing protein [Chloroflexota bacterium]
MTSSPTPIPSPSQDAIAQPTARVLTWGFRISAALLLVGLVMSLIQGEALHTSLEGFSTIVGEIRDGNGAGIVALAILVMIATPIASTIAVVVSCVRCGDTRYARVTGAVLVILFISALLSAR